MWRNANSVAILLGNGEPGTLSLLLVGNGPCIPAWAEELTDRSKMSVLAIEIWRAVTGLHVAGRNSKLSKSPTFPASCGLPDGPVIG